MTKIYNRLPDKDKRKSLRNDSPPAERALWQHLRNRQLSGYRFRRQHGIGRYVVDFYCPEAKLAIEIDGASHEGADAMEYDGERQRFIENLEIRFLRFTNAQIHNHLPEVLATISQTLNDSTP